MELKSAQAIAAKWEVAFKRLKEEYESGKEVEMVVRKKNEKILLLTREKKKLLEDLETMAEHMISQERMATGA